MVGVGAYKAIFMSNQALCCFKLSKGFSLCENLHKSDKYSYPTFHFLSHKYSHTISIQNYELSSSNPPTPNTHLDKYIAGLILTIHTGWVVVSWQIYPNCVSLKSDYYQPQPPQERCATACIAALPTTPHHLQNPKWPPEGPMMADGVCKCVYP